MEKRLFSWIISMANSNTYHYLYICFFTEYQQQPYEVDIVVAFNLWRTETWSGLGDMLMALQLVANEEGTQT